MKRPHRTPATALLLAILWCGTASLSAGVPLSETDRAEREPDAAEMIKARQARIQSSTGIDHQQPVDWNCGSQPGSDAPSDGPAVSAILCDGSFVQLVETPAGASIDLSKSSNTTLVSAPGPVFYSYFVNNPGQGPLTGIILTDDHVDAPPACPQTVLPPGQSMTCSATYTVTATDIANFGSPVTGSGILENNASVTTDQQVDDTANLQIPFAPPTGSMTMDKNSSTVVVTQPGPVSYTYLVTNNGSLPLSGFQLSDNHVDASPTCPQTSLNPGQSMVCSATYTVTQTDIDNMGSPAAGSGFLTNVASISTIEGPSATDSHQIPIMAPDPSNPLVLLPQGSSIGMVPVGEPYEFTFTAVGGQPPLMFSGAGAPAGLSFSQDGNSFILSGIPQETGQFIITVTVTDSATEPNQVSRLYSLRVEDSTNPVLPVLPEVDLPDAIEDQPYNFGLEILGGTPPFEFTADGLPQGLAFTLAGNLLTLAGATGETGDFVIAVTVTDAADPAQTASQSYELRVVPLLRLLPQDTDLGIAQLNQAYQQDFSTTGGLAPVTLTGANAPTGLQFDLNGGQLSLSGTPATAGQFSFMVIAQDSLDPPQIVERSYSLNVVLALDIRPETLPDAFVGNDYLVALSVLNGVPPFSFEASGLPQGLALNGNTISGIPTTSGSFNVIVFAGDALGNAGSGEFLLEVRAAGDVTVGEILPDAYLETEYGHQLSADGAPAPVSWSGGSGLPPGLVLESTGLVNGIPGQTGPFSFSATANTANGGALSGNFNITVLDPELISANPGFPAGQTGVPYQSPTAIRGGIPPFSCAVINGSLPPGLTLNGCNVGIDGTPSEAGSFPFSLGVMDSGTPGLAAQIDGMIQISDTTPIPDPLPPELDFLPPINVPVSELSAQSPGSGFPDETLQGLAVDDWGNRYVVGFSFNGSDYDLRVLKFSADGELAWDQVYDSGSQDYGYGIAVSSTEQAVYASGYSLVGNRYQAVLIRYDLVGVEQWAVNNDSNSQVTAYYALTTDESGIYAVGERYDGSNFDALATRHAHDGSLMWETTRSSQTTRTGYAIIATSCGGDSCLLIGGADGETGRSGWIEQLQAGTGSATPIATVSSAPVYALQARVGGFVSAGNSDTNDWFINAFGNGGQSQWSIALTAGDSLRGLAQDRNGYLYAAGSGNSNNDGMIALISPQGDIEETILYDVGATEVFRGVVVGPDGMLTAAGERNSAAGNRFLVVDFNTGKAN